MTDEKLEKKIKKVQDNEFEHKAYDTTHLYDDEEEVTKFTPELLARDFVTIENWHPLNKLAHIGNALKYAQVGFDLCMIRILDDLELEPQELDELKKSADDRLNSNKEIN
jgi:hypothetical protein